jgi:hypothetical protein
MFVCPMHHEKWLEPISLSALAWLACVACGGSDESPDRAPSGDASTEGPAEDAAQADTGTDTEAAADAAGAEGTTCHEPCDAAGMSCPCADPQAACGSTFDSEIDGKACDVVGRSCFWAPACGGSQCECTETSDDAPRWMCAIRPC